MLLSAHSSRLSSRPVCGQRVEAHYRFWTWQKLFEDVLCFLGFLKCQGLKVGDRVAFITGRSYLRMASELAVMAGGYVSVPLFKGYPAKMKSELLALSKASLLIAEDDADLMDLEPEGLPVRTLVSFSWDSADSSKDLWTQGKFGEIKPDHPALILFTSGTTAFPKGVTITHKNILAQQRAHEILWNLKPDIKLLSYLPWDHVFGSLFERFLALYSGGCLCLDDSGGKDISRLLENFSIIQPDYFFSVPLVYDRIRDYLTLHPQWEGAFFHPRLRFIFTASAPLSPNTAAYFQKKNLPMVEGWGLTETSPSCTLTQPSLKPHDGVGFPIPGVEIKISEENEILVRGHNVMSEYFNAPEKTKEVLDGEGWLKTGDLGEISQSGLKVHGRKDRIFKLSNGRKVNPAEMENTIKSRCPWIHQIYIFGTGKRLPGLDLSTPSISPSF
jgi:long-chain acyl-CoA synthetase